MLALQLANACDQMVTRALIRRTQIEQINGEP